MDKKKDFLRDRRSKFMSTIELINKEPSMQPSDDNLVEQEKDKISKINSINQSVDLTKGEGALIWELQNNMEEEIDDIELTESDKE
mmetsp:Transcript_2488/g.1782  ORF Transcript_2488/g.1782 Transcript_2488/m.1782 type:complete len:86 (-) Transcript_2488:3-260(-)